MNIFKSISVYTFSNIAKQAVGFCLLPIITTYLSQSENGDLSTVVAIVSLISPIILLSTHGAINLEYFRQDHKKENFKRYLSSALINPTVAFLLLCLILYLFGESLASALSIDLFWIYMIPVLSLSYLFPNIISVLFQAKQQPLAHSLYNIGLTTVDLVLSILFIISFQMGWEGRVWGILGSKSLFSLIGIYFLWHGGLLTNKLSKDFAKDALFFALPLIPHIIAASIMDLSDRIFIREMVSREALGVYDIGYKIGSIISILQASLMLAWTPFLFERMKKLTKENKIMITSISYILVLGLLLAAILLTIIAPLIFDWFIGENYAEGIKYVFWIAISYVFLGCYKMFSIFIFYSKKTAILSYVAIFNTITNLLLNYFLIQIYGAIGAAYATMISFFLFFLIIAFISNRLYPMPWFAFRKMFQFIQLNIKQIK